MKKIYSSHLVCSAAEDACVCLSDSDYVQMNQGGNFFWQVFKRSFNFTQLLCIC